MHIRQNVRRTRWGFETTSKKKEARIAAVWEATFTRAHLQGCNPGSNRESLNEFVGYLKLCHKVSGFISNC
jgi:hypothetical protein